METQTVIQHDAPPAALMGPSIGSGRNRAEFLDFGWAHVCMLTLLVVFIYLHVFCFPATPWMIGSDQWVFITEGSRLARGQVMYRDFIEFVAPGTTAIYGLLFRFFGEQAVIPNLVVLLLGTAVVLLLYGISRRVLPPRFALFPPLLFATYTYRTALDGTHHWFSAVLTLAAVYVLLEVRSSRRLLAAGVLLGIATCFTQSRGILALGATLVFLLWETSAAKKFRWGGVGRRAAVLSVGFAGALAVALSYFVAKAGLATFIHSTVTFPGAHFADTIYNRFGIFLEGIPLLGLWRVPLLITWAIVRFCVPATYLVFPIYFARLDRRSQRRRAELLLISLVGLSSYLAIVRSPNSIRVAAAGVPGLVLLGALLIAAGRAGRWCAAALSLVALAILAVGPLRVQAGYHRQLHLPAGPYAFSTTTDYERFRWLAANVRPSEEVFDGFNCRLYLPLHANTPARVAFITPDGLTPTEAVNDLITNLETRRVRYVIWERPLDRSGANDHLGPLRAYLNEHYRPLASLAPGEQILERTP